jgi:pyridoxine 5-phosphate synthase
MTGMALPRLGVNIDHVATIRNARGGLHPDPVRAASLAAQAGADGITAHLREDRRHIGDDDIARLLQFIDLPLNLEMAATDEMLDIALRHKPHASCIVPEKRQELTTEGGLDAAGGHNHLAPFVRQLKDSKIRVSLFIDADPRQISAAADLGAAVIELHAGPYCDFVLEGADHKATRELERLQEAATSAQSLGLEVHAGHGLTFESVGPVAAIPEVMELNIGHFIIGEAIFSGLDSAVKRMRHLIHQARGDASGIQSA